MDQKLSTPNICSDAQKSVSMPVDEDIELIEPPEKARNVTEVDLTEEDDKSNKAAQIVSSPLRGTIKLRSIASLCESDSPQPIAFPYMPTSKPFVKIAPKISANKDNKVGEIVEVKEIPSEKRTNEPIKIAPKVSVDEDNKVGEIFGVKGIPSEKSTKEPVKTITPSKIKICDLAKKIYGDVIMENSSKSIKSPHPVHHMNLYNTEREVGPAKVGLSVFKSVTETRNLCLMCSGKRMCRYNIIDVNQEGKRSFQFLCSTTCCTEFGKALVRQLSGPQAAKREFKCMICYKALVQKTKQDSIIHLNNMDFCSHTCLKKFVALKDAKCFRCQISVTKTNLLKFAVSFGSQTKQFCSYKCIQDFVRSYTLCVLCHQVQDKEESKKTNVEAGFCGWRCVRRKSQIDIGQANYKLKNHCSVCQKFDVNLFKYDALNGKTTTQPVLLCSQQCVAVFAYVNKLDLEHCGLCSVMVNMQHKTPYIHINGQRKSFCSDECFSIYITVTQKLVTCVECEVEKFDYDMIAVPAQKVVNFFCSISCVEKNEERNASNGIAEHEPCAMCHKVGLTEYRMIMSDNTMRPFCSYSCAINFKSTFGFLVPSPGNETVIPQEPSMAFPIHNVNEAAAITQLAEELHKSIDNLKPKDMCNKSISCRLDDSPTEKNADNQMQTSDSGHVYKPIFIPVPVPIFVPTPMMMYSSKVPVPLTVPLPVPIPMVLPSSEKAGEIMVNGVKPILEETESSVNDENSNRVNEVPNGTNSFEDDSMRGNNTADSEERSEVEVDTNHSKETDASSEKKRKLDVSNDDDEETLKRRKIDESENDINGSNLQFSNAFNFWTKWVDQKNEELRARSPTSKLLPSNPAELSPGILNHSLCIFVAELPQIEKSEFSVEEIFSILLGIQNFLTDQKYEHNIFWGDEFKKFASKLDSMITHSLKTSNLRDNDGVPAQLLWDAELLGTHSPHILLMTVAYFVALEFGLSTVQQHSSLRMSTVRDWCEGAVSEGDETTLQNNCSSSIFQIYLSKCGICNTSNAPDVSFYLKPKENSSSGDWYEKEPLDTEELTIICRKLFLVKEVRKAIIKS